MERGITYDQVAAAADEISARGDRPTLRAVRDALGTGSLGTIQRHIAAWQNTRRHLVATTVSLPTEIQRVILEQIEREVDRARAELEADLVAVRTDRDTLADENETMTERLQEQAAQLAQAEQVIQQQHGRIGQLEADLEAHKVQAERERAAAEQARQALARAELRLEALPRLEVDLAAVRADLAVMAERAISAEQRAAVTAEKLAGIEARLADALEREQQITARLAEAEQAVKVVGSQADEYRFRLLEAEAAREIAQRAEQAMREQAQRAEQRAALVDQSEKDAREQRRIADEFKMMLLEAHAKLKELEKERAEMASST